MYERFRSLTAANPEATAIIEGDTGRAISRRELLRRTDAFAVRLADAGIVAGEAIAIQLPNSADFIALVAAVVKEKAITLLIDRGAPETEVARILGHFAVRALAYPDNGNVLISTRPPARGPAVPPGARLIKLTSGSTGMPKGIVMSEANLAADAANICRTMDIRPDDVNFGAIPMSHSYGFSNLVTPLLMQGTAVVISNDYLPQTIVNLCNTYRCTVVPLIPMVFDHLVTAASGEFETARTFISAGAPLTPATSRRFRERFGRPIHTFYGCSECGGITYDRQGGSVERGTVGTAMDGVDLDTRDGRLIVRGENVAVGHLHDASSFEPFEPGRFVADDLVEVRADGEITLTGRASDMINAAGRKVNPREVEQVLLQMEGVREAKVYGEPAGARGEVVAAAIVGSPDVTRERVREFCRARLSLHKVPRIVKLIESIPLDDRGKVRRSALAAL